MQSLFWTKCVPISPSEMWFQEISKKSSIKSSFSADDFIVHRPLSFNLKLDFIWIKNDECFFERVLALAGNERLWLSNYENICQRRFVRRSNIHFKGKFLVLTCTHTCMIRKSKFWCTKIRVQWAYNNIDVRAKSYPSKMIPVLKERRTKQW